PGVNAPNRPWRSVRAPSWSRREPARPTTMPSGRAMSPTRVRPRPRARVAVAALALGGLLVVAGPASVAVADTPTVVDSYTSGSFPFAVAVSPDGGTLYVAN